MMLSSQVGREGIPPSFTRTKVAHLKHNTPLSLPEDSPIYVFTDSCDNTHHPLPSIQHNIDMEQLSDPWEKDGHGGRQPNFLQKLYHLLSLDPHPCPDVIYWATDSRQLVIAQPDRLVKEVLPRLFKHDKLASFGRQLNIYGFSRLFPGFQFQDANGNLSDASVWAHPTLHRMSTDEEVARVKRRAAPKLFRTRRLANGQLVRTKAGPAVEARVREVRESIAESRRHRGSIGYQRQEEHNVAITHTPLLHEACCSAPEDLQEHASPGFTDMRYHADPVEQCRSNTFTSPLINYYSPHETRINPILLDYPSPIWTGDRYVFPSPNADRTQSFDLGDNQVLALTMTAANVPNQSLTLSGPRTLQSCPASIHTTPVPIHTVLDDYRWSFQSTVDPLRSDAQGQHSEERPKSPLKIAAPAATPPKPANTHLMIDTSVTRRMSAYPLSPSSGLPSAVAPQIDSPAFQALRPGRTSVASSGYFAQASLTSTEENPTQLAGAWPISPGQPFTHQAPATIDPRWVSPTSSAFNSVAPTPVMSPMTNPLWIVSPHETPATTWPGVTNPFGAQTNEDNEATEAVKYHSHTTGLPDEHIDPSVGPLVSTGPLHFNQAHSTVGSLNRSENCPADMHLNWVAGGPLGAAKADESSRRAQQIGQGWW